MEVNIQSHLRMRSRCFFLTIPSKHYEVMFKVKLNRWANHCIVQIQGSLEANIFIIQPQLIHVEKKKNEKKETRKKNNPFTNTTPLRPCLLARKNIFCIHIFPFKHFMPFKKRVELKSQPPVPLMQNTSWLPHCTHRQHYTYTFFFYFFFVVFTSPATMQAHCKSLPLCLSGSFSPRRRCDSLTRSTANWMTGQLVWKKK